MKIKPKKVISASRRVELVGFYPDHLANALEERCPPEKIHSIVLWSKAPQNLLNHQRLNQTIKKYNQLFLHFTISGMGGSFLEPGIPDTKTCLSLLPELINFLKSPSRIRIRFDPIVHFKLPNNRQYTNLYHFHEIATQAKKSSIEHIVISWMEEYPKVIKRLQRYRIKASNLSPEEWEKEKDWIFDQARSIGLQIYGCCVPRLEKTKCIDGKLLMSLHPLKETLSTEKARGQRKQCGCIKSWDIGWYYCCPGGCVYCYANPVVLSTLNGSEPI